MHLAFSPPRGFSSLPEATQYGERYRQRHRKTSTQFVTVVMPSPSSGCGRLRPITRRWTYPRETCRRGNGTGRKVEVDEPGNVTQFDKIDNSGDTNYFEQFLTKAAFLSGIQQARAAMTVALRLDEGHALLDVGCGLGECATELARVVGPRGQAVAVDASRGMVARARARSEGESLRPAFLMADAHRLPFRDASFDASRAERLLVSLADPDLALRELVRVVKPGGRIVVQDVDNDTFFVDTPYPETTRTLVTVLSDGESNGTIGRRLPRLFLEQGLVEIEILPFTVLITFELFELLFDGIVARAQELGALARQDAEEWCGYLRRAHAEGKFFGGGTVFVVSGTRSR